MNLTERILELLKSDTLKTSEVADILGANVGVVSGTISRLVRQGLVVVVSRKKNNWTYRSARGANIGPLPSLTEQILDLLRTEGLTVPEIDQKLDVGKVSTVIPILTKRAKAGEVKVVGSRPSEKTGRMINVYGINPDYAKKRGSAKAARTSKVSKELSKHFRVFKPTYGPVMGVWL